MFLVVLHTLLRVPWTARRSNQSILNETSPGCSLEGLMLKLKLQYFGHLMQRVDSLEKSLMLGEVGGRRRRGRQRMKWHQWLDGHEFGLTLGVGDEQGDLAYCDSWGCQESDMTERLTWTEDNVCYLSVAYLFNIIYWECLCLLCFVLILHWGVSLDSSYLWKRSKWI